MRKIILLLIVSIGSLLTFSGCNKGDDFDIAGLGNSLYGDIKITPPKITFDLDYMTFNTDDSTARIFFTAFAKKTVSINEVRVIIQPYPIGPDTTRIVNITNDKCLIDEAKQPEALSFKMIRNDSYDFCYNTDVLKANTEYQITFLFYGYETGVDVCCLIIGRAMWGFKPF